MLRRGEKAQCLSPSHRGEKAWRHCQRHSPGQRGEKAQRRSRCRSPGPITFVSRDYRTLVYILLVSIIAKEMR